MYFLQLVSETSETLMFKIYLPHQKQLVSERQKIFKFMFFKLLPTRQKFFKFIFSSTCFFQSCFLISVGNFSDFFSLICFCNRQVQFSFYICISFVKTCLFKLESYFVMFTSDPSFFRKSSLICSLITSTSVSDELLALFLNHFFRKYTDQSRAKLS